MDLIKTEALPYVLYCAKATHPWRKRLQFSIHERQEKERLDMENKNKEESLQQKKKKNVSFAEMLSTMLY